MAPKLKTKNDIRFPDVHQREIVRLNPQPPLQLLRSDLRVLIVHGLLLTTDCAFLWDYFDLSKERKPSDRECVLVPHLIYGQLQCSVFYRDYGSEVSFIDMVNFLAQATDKFSTYRFLVRADSNGELYTWRACKSRDFSPPLVWEIERPTEVKPLKVSEWPYH